MENWFHLFTFSFIVNYQSAATQDGPNFLENIILFFRQNETISTGHLEELLYLVSSRRPESITVNNPLANQKCLSAGQILAQSGLANLSQLSVEHLERLCPAVLTQVLLPSCPFTVPETLPPVDYSVWGYGFLAVTIINLASLLGLFLLPFTKKSYFPKVLTYFIGLAIGTLFSNAVLQLIPEALGFDPKEHNYVDKAVGIFGGFYVLFFVEKVLKMALGLDHDHSHSHFTPVEQPENSIHNGVIAEKKDSIILTSINTISTGDMSQTNMIPAQVNKKYGHTWSHFSIALFHLQGTQSALQQGTTHPFTHTFIHQCTQTLWAGWVKCLAQGHNDSIHLWELESHQPICGSVDLTTQPVMFMSRAGFEPPTLHSVFNAFKQFKQLQYNVIICHIHTGITDVH
ncbi:metal cation symporter ZIP8 [Boleophthalmus pectinirostris]|uniref:metal cation symporter ZIP8 n=1 Tax=Boleophthalmus pectinirostris TaxID=150288 RepID=UPI00242A43C0|nr:metal cation symporter ZIP8 [Boleophthalmus pectinirostris]